MKKLVAGNWKMNGSLSVVQTLFDIAEYADDYAKTTDTILYVPAVYIHMFTTLKAIKIGGQDCHYEKSGAFTGDISADMLKDVGAVSVILGHSERRTECHETNEIIYKKAESALRCGLMPVICVGESKQEYQEKISTKVVIEQIKKSVPENKGNIAIGYEPIWAIGTGLIPQMNEIQDMHGVIRTTLTELIGKDAAQKARILYGGSVKPDNADAIAKLADVDGALVGGASLKASEFSAIIKAFGSV